MSSYGSHKNRTFNVGSHMGSLHSFEGANHFDLLLMAPPGETEAATKKSVQIDDEVKSMNGDAHAANGVNGHVQGRRRNSPNHDFTHEPLNHVLELSCLPFSKRPAVYACTITGKIGIPIPIGLLHCNRPSILKKPEKT
jgi:hypothetical protein